MQPIKPYNKIYTMFDIFKSNQEGRSSDAKQIRDQILQFIKQRLKKVEGGEGNNIKGIHLFIAAQGDEKTIYESAVYFDQQDKFKNEEVQRIADDYAVDLPADWSMEIEFVDQLPAEARPVPGLQAGIFISTKKNAVQRSATAYLKVCLGEAEKKQYQISSGSGKICIGREKEVQAADGFFRKNDIAFVGDHESNKFVSRQHAHIEFDNDSGCFVLYADDGGVPPRNKVKVRSVADDQPVKLYSTGIGYRLKDGDQILLGQSALLEFSLSPGENQQ
jgi:hypothetical protein